MKRRTLGTLTVTLAFALAGPVAAQSTGPTHAGYDPNAPRGGHFHDGDIGEKWLALERSIKCNCTCNLDTHSCQFQMQCGVSPGWSQQMRASLEAGQEPEVIQAAFVAQFGPTVLMAPPPEGFNLLGYFMPMIALLSAGVLVGLLVRGGPGGPKPAPVEHPTDEQVERLREELERLEEYESPDW